MPNAGSGSLLGGSSYALGINNPGEVVGYSADPFSIIDHAFLYSDGQTHDLNSLIPPESGWTLAVATGINDASQIVGFGTNANGETHAFLLTPAHGPLSPRSMP